MFKNNSITERFKKTNEEEKKTYRENPVLSKIIQWSKLISITAGAQLLIQALGFISGILIIRLLPVEEYAFYTLGNTILGTMVVLADGGIATGVTAIYGRVWKTKKEAGRVVISGLELRKKFAVISLIVGIPVLFFLLRHHNASWLLATLMVLSLIPAFLSSLSATIYEIPLLFHQEIVPLQKNHLKVNVGRLILLFATVFIFPWAFMAILAGGIAQFAGNLGLKKLAGKRINWAQDPDPLMKKEMLGFVKKLMPGAIYYCVSGQITVWLISVFGATNTIAEIGALGRLAMILTIVSSVFHTVITPRFIKLKNKKNQLLKKYLMIILALIFLSIGILLLFWIFSTQALEILGSTYEGLERELVLFLGASCLELIVGICFVLNSNKGWLVNPYINILVGISSISMGIVLFDISTLNGILLFKLFSAFVIFLFYVIFGISSILKLPNSKIVS
ncbi:polysaccharide biosynthesis protein [Salegentibacter sp. JZCK2]|uniref:lipopolysaccharide biosynthesis protein n=1 Tax=Salegentibacter tibetensis TaxID=2873600 RepID=UPI001CC9AC70|nr:polysaccharide biosynthesis protein [Salegentibacter tibetensis]MBZ9731298.1 polysaccharide biosynthesis protein [Salegentibacter tibetensis]